MRLVTLLLMLTLQQSLNAAEAVVGMSEKVFNALDEVQASLDAGELPQAQAQLGKLLEDGLSPYERAHTLNLLAYTHYEQDAIGEARRLYEEALLQPELPNSMQVNLLMTLGQVSLVQEDHAAAERYLRRLLQLPDQDLPQHRVLLAAALLGQEHYRDARELLTSAIDAVANAGREPREQWLSMLASVNYELEDYPAMRDVLRRLTTLYPREQYLMNLAALHGQLGDSGRQLSLIESLRDDDRLEQSTRLLMLANLFLAEGLPFEAAQLLQGAIDDERVAADRRNLELLSQAWYLAAETERAIEPLARAAELAEDGELFMRLARLHMDANNWSAANEAARRALDKGKLRQEGHAWLLRGMAKAYLEQFREADGFFRRAARFEHSENFAGQWLSYIASEEEAAALRREQES